MSGQSNYNISTTTLEQCDMGVEEYLHFYRHELPHIFDDGDTGEIGLNINFFIDDSEKYEDDGHYEIYYVPTNNKKFKQQLPKEKRNRIIILHNCTDTTEIRNLAAWLEEQANAIDEEKEIIEKETG